MALTTLCPNCQTRFRVVHDQLKLREGLVRCGACQTIFNANDHLIDPLTPASSPPRKIIPSSEASAQETARLDHADLPLTNPPYTNPPYTNPPYTNPPYTDLPHADLPVDTATPLAAEFPDPRGAQDDPRDVQDIQDIQEAAASQITEGATDVASQPTDETEEPGFVIRTRKAQRRARIGLWIMSVGSIILMFGGLGQATYVWRNQIAASMPALKAPLEAACNTLGCQIGLSAQIEAVAIESSELVLSEDQPNALVLSLTLRNHSARPQAWPYFELTLLDTSTQPVIRRILVPKEYLSQPKEVFKGLSANAEQNIKLTFAVARQKPTDYRIAVFYP